MITRRTSDRPCLFVAGCGVEREGVMGMLEDLTPCGSFWHGAPGHECIPLERDADLSDAGGRVEP